MEEKQPITLFDPFRLARDQVRSITIEPTRGQCFVLPFQTKVYILHDIGKDKTKSITLSMFQVKMLSVQQQCCCRSVQVRTVWGKGHRPKYG
jgi:hypothetical protein